MSKAQTPTPVLVIDDDPSMLDLARYWLEKEGYEVVTAETGGQGLQLVAQRQFPLALTDYQLPDVDGLELVSRIKADSPETEIIMITGYGSDPRVREAANTNAFYFHAKPVEFEDLLILIRRALEHGQQARRIKELRKIIEQPSAYHNIIGRSRAMQNVYDIIESVAESDANVLIVGESGTGKELVASAIHHRSHRRSHPFMQVNCAALPKELIESELFGHTKGAFTGAASDKVGLIGRAAGGSVLLDEISEMPLELQPKLLRVLQERVYYRVGSEKALSADFRLIAATNRPPLEAIRAGFLREDLYYRLNTIELQVPPLRERIEDVPYLAEHFLRRYAERYERKVHQLSPQAYEQLINHHWPGNVRELQNAIERAVLLCKGEVIDLLYLPAIQQVNGTQVTSAKLESATPTPIAPQPTAPTSLPASSQGSLPASPNATSAADQSIEQLCRIIISQLPEPPVGTQADELFKQLEVYLAQAAVERTKGNKQAAANLLGIYRPRLYSLLKKGAEQNNPSVVPIPIDNAKEDLPANGPERASAAG